MFDVGDGSGSCASLTRRDSEAEHDAADVQRVCNSGAGVYVDTLIVDERTAIVDAAIAIDE